MSSHDTPWLRLQNAIAFVGRSKHITEIMWLKFKEQLPLVIIFLLGIAGAVYWLHARTIGDLSLRQQEVIANLRADTNAELQASAEQTRRQIDAVNTLLKDAIAARASDMFLTDEEIATVNAEKMDSLAAAIAAKIQPFNPLPKTPEEAARQQDQELDKVSAGIATRIEPILAELAQNQNLTSEALADYSQKISDQISVILTSELEKNQRLNASLLDTQAVARESLGLSQELAALYLSSFKDQGVLTRLLTLPANVIRDASQLSIVNSSERAQREEDLMARMAAIQEKLDAISIEAPR